MAMYPVPIPSSKLCILYLEPCILLLVFCVLYLVCCNLNPVSCVIYPVLCILYTLYLVSCIPYLRLLQKPKSGLWRHGGLVQF